MQYSQRALFVFAASDLNFISSNANFWTKFADEESFCELVSSNGEIKKRAEELKQQYLDVYPDIKVICAYDDEFPIINPYVKRNSEKPYLLFCKGNVSLLANLNHNVCVIGNLNPDSQIIKRETAFVDLLVQNDMVIVSGLAKGCDALAHSRAVKYRKKTIAILPSPIQEIYPPEHISLATEIVECGGLLVSEYYKSAQNRYESINRLVSRDRLQALFAKAVILCASYRKGEGDSGSRHAMRHALEYKVLRYVLYNEKTDLENPRFGLNRDILTEDSQVKVLSNRTIQEIIDYKMNEISSKQQTLF